MKIRISYFSFTLYHYSYKLFQIQKARELILIDLK